MYNDNFINSDIRQCGLYRGFVIYDGTDSRVYVPGLDTTMTIISNNSIDIDKYLKNKYILPKALFVSNSLNSNPILTPMPCWVTFESGDTKRPIVMGYFGTGIRSSGSSFNFENNMTVITDPMKYVTEELKGWCFPLVSKEGVLNPNEGSRWFGANRNSGARKHAGMDFVKQNGMEVLACCDGTVINYYYFYQANNGVATYALEVKCKDSSHVIRYGEIVSDKRAGDTVVRGEVIGTVVGTSMLHLELYMGTVTGGLTERSNSSNYTYVSPANYQRRSDLLNPHFIWDLPLVSENKEVEIDASAGVDK